ncbi:EAL domain-containing protein [Anaerobacillus sp. HL2]|nr:EAL domain-containing protein [Anaerobacillus sp. HL2]
MSKALGLIVIAEGIETETQYSILQELDCDAMQGFTSLNHYQLMN